MKKLLPLLILSLFLGACAPQIQYVGERNEKGEYHGQGTATFADGTKYIGEWKDDNFNGQGTLTYANGEKWEGEFKDGLPFNGHGTHTYVDGAKYVGDSKMEKQMVRVQGPILMVESM